MLRIEKYANREFREIEKIGFPQLVLPFGLRQKSRSRATLDDGAEVAIFLPRGTVLREGDLLEASDGTIVRVVAAPEHVIQVTADTPHALMRAAYHLGNRHTPVELGEGFLKLETDPVLQQMLLRLGVAVREDYLPFQPEPGAYGTRQHQHGHDSSFSEEYTRAQKLFQEHHGHDQSENQGHRHTRPQDESHTHEHP